MNSRWRCCITPTWQQPQLLCWLLMYFVLQPFCFWSYTQRTQCILISLSSDSLVGCFNHFLLSCVLFAGYRTLDLFFCYQPPYLHGMLANAHACYLIISLQKMVTVLLSIRSADLFSLSQMLKDQKTILEQRTTLFFSLQQKCTIMDIKY